MDRKITVAFCLESELSGTNKMDFMLFAWCRNDFEVSKEYSQKVVILNFRAVVFCDCIINEKR